MAAATCVAVMSLAIWLGLLVRAGAPGRAAPGLDRPGGPLSGRWPEVIAIVPARNEAETVELALRSLLAQDYGGVLTVLVIDDHSEDATRSIAERLAAAAAGRLEVIAAPPLPPGWSGKLWALAAGLRRVEHLAPAAPYVLLTDADIAHPPGNLARLVAKAESERLDMVSLMVRLHCTSFWEHLLIPPFVFFFEQLYPLAKVNDPGARIAAAAGGCLLLRRRALREIGGISAIRGELIDDVALARAIKHRPGGGRIWLGVSRATYSLRRHGALGDLWAMVARTADTQVRHSLLLLAGTLLGLAVVYLVPPVALVAGLAARDPWPAGLGGLALAAMAVAFLPTLRLYGLRLGWSLTLPLAALLYAAMTVDSAIQHRRGAGGRWKGRIRAPGA